MFYTFSQNNSGGVFDRDSSVDDYVIIEANSAEQANRRAQAVGIYFDGCRAGLDCDCCGDRWYEQWDDTDGSVAPEIYGDTDLKDYRVFVHYQNGVVDHFDFSKGR